MIHRNFYKFIAESERLALRNPTAGLHPGVPQEFCGCNAEKIRMWLRITHGGSSVVIDSVRNF
jgi:hypothetical protein